MNKFAIACTLAAAGAASATDITLTLNVPTGDRYMYPFAPGAGTETRISAFAALNAPGFDDRDAEMLLFWDTDQGAGSIPSALGAGGYRVKSVRVRVRTFDDLKFTYDPTPDSVRTSYLPTDPDFIADSDPGKPIEMFGVGFRGAFQTQEFQETSPFPFGSQVEGSRNAYPAVFSEAGVPTDVANNVAQRFEVTPFAIGTTDAVAPGQRVPAETEITFDVNVCDPAVRAYVARALNQGRLYLLVSSLAPAAGGPGGGSGEKIYPDFISKEESPALSAKIEIVVGVGSPADVTGDGTVDLADFFDFFQAYDLTQIAADVNADCVVDLADFFDFFQAYDAG